MGDFEFFILNVLSRKNVSAVVAINKMFLLPSLFLGYHYVTITRCTPNGDGTFKYFVHVDDGRPEEVTLVGADRDPLRSVGNYVF